MVPEGGIVISKNVRGFSDNEIRRSVNMFLASVHSSKGGSTACYRAWISKPSRTDHQRFLVQTLYIFCDTA